MTPYSPGAVVLLHFPFTDLRTTKKRPAVVISPPEYSQRYGDVAVLSLTSKPQPESYLSLQHWRTAGLLDPTWLKPALFTVSQSIIDRQIGTLHPDDAALISAALSLLIAGSYRP
jgi:mRNA interferase MazF